MVFVPYCTGDFHAGNNVATYDVFGPRPYHHVGRRNVEALLPRIQATWPAPARVVVAGSSAGGFGATLSYDIIRRAYAGAAVALVNDAGPLLVGNGFPADERRWRDAGERGPGCRPARRDATREGRRHAAAAQARTGRERS